MSFSSLTYAELRSRFLFRSIGLVLSRFIGLVAFLSGCFEFADKVSEEAQHGSLANLPEMFSSHLHGLSKVAVVGFYA